MQEIKSDVSKLWKGSNSIFSGTNTNTWGPVQETGNLHFNTYLVHVITISKYLCVHLSHIIFNASIAITFGEKNRYIFIAHCFAIFLWCMDFEMKYFTQCIDDNLVWQLTISSQKYLGGEARARMAKRLGITETQVRNLVTYAVCYFCEMVWSDH